MVDRVGECSQYRSSSAPKKAACTNLRQHRRKGRKIGDEAEEVAALLRELGHEKCYVGGWSGGGMSQRSIQYSEPRLADE
jgi:pimeloyl-ACP methyl ester carboxylesterase